MELKNIINEMKLVKFNYWKKEVETYLEKNAEKIQKSESEVLNSDMSKKDITDLVASLLKMFVVSANKIKGIEEKHFKQKDVHKIFKKYGNFLLPETDRSNDTLGVEPGSICNYIVEDNFSLEEIQKSIDLANLLLKEGVSLQPFMDYEIEEPDFNRFFNAVISEIVKNNKDLEYFEQSYLDALISFLPDQYANYNNELYAFVEMLDESSLKELANNIQKAKETFDKVISLDTKMFEEVINNADSISLEILDRIEEEFLQKRKELWIQKIKRAPRSKAMLMLDPDKFNPKIHLKLIEKITGSKQLANASEEQQNDIVALISFFGPKNEYFYSRVSKKNIKNFVQEIEKQIKLTNPADITGSLKVFEKEDLINFKEDAFFITALEKVVSINPKFEKDILDFYKSSDKKKETLKRIKKLIEISHSLFDSKNELSGKINLRFIFSIDRYLEELSINELNALFSVYENRSKKSLLPEISGKSGKYKYEILSKDNPLGLILGYATDCCQVIGNAGENCLRRGYDSENSGFFTVYQKNYKIYAQSWVWTIETFSEKPLKVLVYDSVEILGRNGEFSEDILKAYFEASKEMVEKDGYDLVLASTYGNTVPKGLDTDPVRFKVWGLLRTLGVKFPFKNTYSDFRDFAVIMALSEKALQQIETLSNFYTLFEDEISQDNDIEYNNIEKYIEKTMQLLKERTVEKEAKDNK